MNILFLYVHDWAHEIASYRRGMVPSHRLWGFAEIGTLGHTAVTAPSAPAGARPSRWRLLQAMFALRSQRDTDCIVAVNEATALPVLLLKRLGLLRTPIVVLGFSLLHERNASGWRHWLLRWLLPVAERIASLSRAQAEWVAREFRLPAGRSVFLPMAVDTAFYENPGPSPEPGDFCLSAGTNDAKDFPTLLKAFPRDQRLVVVTDAHNARKIAGCLEPGARVEVRQNVPITELRELYRRARLVILPLADVRTGSGHTVLLENMALGKAVIVSGVPGVRDYVEDGVNAIVVRPHDSAELGRKIREFLAAPGRFESIGREAAVRARAEFSAVEYGRRLLCEIDQITQQARQPNNEPSYAQTARTAEES